VVELDSKLEIEKNRVCAEQAKLSRADELRAGMRQQRDNADSRRKELQQQLRVQRQKVTAQESEISAAKRERRSAEYRLNKLEELERRRIRRGPVDEVYIMYVCTHIQTHRTAPKAAATTTTTTTTTTTAAMTTMTTTSSQQSSLRSAARLLSGSFASCSC
jgi:hypothetical protein